MSYAVQLQQFPGQSLAVVRRRAPLQMLSRVIPEACGLVWNHLRAQGIRGGRHVAVYLDNEFNLQVGAELNVPFVESSEVVASQLPACTVATTTHFGPYQRLKDAHQAVIDWCNAHGHEMMRPCWETYGHWLEEWNHDPGKIRTDVFYRLKS